MPFEPGKITRDHVLKAIQKIEVEKIPLQTSTRYSVFIGNKPYPPKEVMRYAHEQMNGEKVWWLSGGEPTNRILANLGFKVDSIYNPGDNPDYLTDTVMKLGCNWGSGAPSFYHLIKQRQIVISNSPFAIGDLVMITEGFQVMAIARVLDEFEFAAIDPSLEKPFEELQINYDDSVSFSRAEWYELPKEYQFQYQLQAGIRKVQDPEVRNKVVTLWREMHDIARKSKSAAIEPSKNSIEDANEQVKEAQALLRSLGLFTGAVDGFLGPATEQALMSFQRANNLIVKGDIDGQTLSRLREIAKNPPNSGKKNFWLLKVALGEISNPAIEVMHFSPFIVPGAWASNQKIQPGDAILPFELTSEGNIFSSFYVEEMEIHTEGLQLQLSILEMFEQRVSNKIWPALVAIDYELFDPRNRRELFPITKEEFDGIISLGRITKGGAATDVIKIENELKKASLDNDEAFAPKDYLGFSKDIRAFASLMAMKNTTPPLAIALFGKWGTGKSFFMHHLQSIIRFVSVHQCFPTADGQPPVAPLTEKHFCEGIVQIPFNAWSYLDANLWAGLVSSIFEKLDEHINDYTKGARELQQMKDILSSRLHILAEEKENLVLEQERLKQEKISLELKKENLQTEGEELKRELQDTIPEKVIQEIKSADLTGLNIKDELKKMGMTDEEMDSLAPETLKKKVKSYRQFFRYTWTIAGVWKFLAFVIPVLILVLWFVPQAIIDDLQITAKKFWGYILLLSPVVIHMLNIWRKWKPLLRKVDRYVMDFNEASQEIDATVRAKKEQLQTEIARNAGQAAAVEQKLTVVRSEERLLCGSISFKAFSGFVSRRMGSRDYEDKLGIISIVRRDLETLSGLFRKPDHDNTADQQVVELDSGYNDLQDEKKTGPGQRKKELEKDQQLIREQFKGGKTIERIILYIDDLDRCEDAKVLEVLQAVHLLMAFPLFIVVVGVDPRCVKNALAHRNLLQYQAFFSGGNLRAQLKENKIDIIEPDEYLEKIFQIPFHLAQPAEERIKEMVQDLLIKQVRKEEVKKNSPQDLAAQLQREPQLAPPSDLTPPDVRDQQLPDTTAGKSNPKDKEIGDKPVNLSPADLLLSQEEYDCLVEIITLVSKTPRTIKRFINMYRIIRAHELLSYDKSAEQETFLAVMFTVALNTGDFRRRADKLFAKMLKNPAMTIQQILESHGKCEWIIKGISDSSKLRPLLSMTCSRAVECIRFTRRFSFGG
jgi:hypothetical protein